ncbi:MAG: flavin reductase [Calditrichaeota bacterium]|nr:flavin reductase [Calditrichota bacterium]
MHSKLGSTLIGIAILVLGTVVFLFHFRDADGQSPAAGQLKVADGVYRAKEMGYNDSLTVEVRVSRGRIASVRVVEHYESAGDSAIKYVPQWIVRRQGTEGVDVVTGATITSRAILGAARKALAQAATKSAPPPSASEEHGKKSLGARTALTPLPVWVIGSYDSVGRANMMTAAWVGICCSQPPSVMVALRKATYTFGNIVMRQAFTVNIPSVDYAAETAYFGSVSGRDVDKLSVTGLTPVRSKLVDAPYLQEFPLVAECRLRQTYEVGLHTMFIGEIVDVKAAPGVLDAEGKVDVELLRPFVYGTGKGSFYTLGQSLGTTASLRAKYTR